jgi:hypothetical protein
MVADPSQSFPSINSVDNDDQVRLVVKVPEAADSSVVDLLTLTVVADIPTRYSSLSVVVVFDPACADSDDECDGPNHSIKSSNFMEMRESLDCPEPLAVTCTTARS